MGAEILHIRVDSDDEVIRRFTRNTIIKKMVVSLVDETSLPPILESEKEAHRFSLEIERQMICKNVPLLFWGAQGWTFTSHHVRDFPFVIKKGENLKLRREGNLWGNLVIFFSLWVEYD